MEQHGVDNKYGRVFFEESNTIGEDEPVVVFRAADPLLPRLLAKYQGLCLDASCPPKHIDLLLDTGQKVEDWQRDNPEKVRELPTSSNWDGVYRG